jgi:hypothetical protein
VSQATSTGDPVEIRFRSEPTSGDVLWNSASLVRRSAFTLVLGTFLMVTSALTLFLGDLFSLIGLAIGLALLTGAMIVPFVWWSIRQRRDLVLAVLDVTADRAGLTITSTQASTRQDWSIYRRVNETSRAFLLSTGMSATVLLAKRGMSPTELDAFRALLAEVGLLRPARRFDRIRQLVWVAVGLALAGALILAPRLIGGIGATATMNLETSVNGHTVTLKGSTDLPDGAVVAVELVQTAEWERDAADGTAPDPSTSRWVLDQVVTVSDGEFTADFSPAGWPSGHLGAYAYFWVDPGQPPAVIERFGSDGSGLRGPDVVDLDDRGPTIELERTVEIKG